MLGEDYDARMEIKAGISPAWTRASGAGHGARRILPRSWNAQVMEPVRETGEIKAQSRHRTQTRLLDVMTWAKHGGRRAVKVVRAGGHQDHPSPRRDAEPRRHALHDQLARRAFHRHYVCKGDGIEIWQPRFTFHGFRYVEISGLAGTAGDRCGHGNCHRLGHPARRRVRLFRCAHQPASVQHPMGPARQLYQHPHRLSAAR